MADPPRFTDESGAAGDLFRSAKDDAPGKDLPDRIVANIRGAPATGAAPSSLVWIGGGLAAILIGGAAYVASHNEPPPVVPPVTVVADAAPSAELVPPPTPSVEPATSVEPVAVASASAIASAAAKAPPSASAASTDDLAAEIAALDTARSAMAAGNPNGALKALDDYGKRFPKGALSQEATILRIEALAASGNDEAAKKLGHEFLRQHPNSAHRSHIRTLLHE